MNTFSVPSGMRDLVLTDAKKKRQLQQEIEKTFKRWGYDEVITPGIEYYETYEVGFQNVKEEDFYKSMDDHGRIVTLKADMTIPIARVCATKFKEIEGPLRFSYSANVFKAHEMLSGNKNEITDCGVELIGLKEPEGDIEILVTALDALKVVEKQDFTFEIGDVRFFKEACKAAKLNDEQMETLAMLIDRKALVELKDYVKALKVDDMYATFFTEMIWWSGPVDVLAKARSYACNDALHAVIDNLEKVYETLQSLGYEDMVSFDLSKIGNLNYYTGIIFDAFVEGVGLRVLSGGRYDDLLARFGKSSPAVGFSIKLDQLMEAYAYENTDTKVEIEYGEGALVEAITKRKEFTEDTIVVLAPNPAIKGVKIKGESL
ncbi:hypothetical protein A4S06_04505 [Erysipelotrichaceae bacterium MTC7]|nr:hypothetical protein A4S06_04505 [Erysipelotrichaceae bacterium MTC7]